ncbi:MAG: CYTH domain-containing protein, partial [bacterium]|nr:CYTH domain-containing protein [bacterium]
MIEIERKFRWTPEAEAALLVGAEFLKERTFTDEYFDTAKFDLSTKDIWMRKRDDVWELKIPVHDLARKNVMSTQYEERDTEEGIREFLQLPATGTFGQDLEDAGYVSCGLITTHRRSYRKDGFVIVFDDVTAEGGYVYRLLEIELMTDGVSAEAEEAINQFGRAHGLDGSY